MAKPPRHLHARAAEIGVITGPHGQELPALLTEAKWGPFPVRIMAGMSMDEARTLHTGLGMLIARLERHAAAVR